MKKIISKSIYIFVFLLSIFTVFPAYAAKVAEPVIEKPGALCTDPSTIRAVRYLAYSIDMLQMIVPIIIIITGVISLAKAVMGDDDGQIRKSLTGLVTKIIIGAMIALIPVAMTAIFKQTNLYSENNCVKCVLSVSECDKLLIEKFNQSTVECGAYLGSVSDDESPAYYLQLVFNYMKYIGVLLCIVLSAVDFVKVILDDNKDGYKPAASKALKRMGYVLALFFMPTLIKYILTWVGAYASPTCGIR